MLYPIPVQWGRHELSPHEFIDALVASYRAFIEILEEHVEP